MIDLGDAAHLTVTITDSTDALVDATSLTLTIILPDQTPATPTPVHDGIGKYHYDYLTVQEGTHHVRWVSTGGVPFGDPKNFYVESATDISLTSLDDAKKQLRITSSTADDELRGYLKSVAENVESTHGVCVIRSFTQRCAGDGLALVLANRPVLSLTSITAVYPWQPAVALTDVTTNLTTGVVTRLDGFDFYGPYDVVHKAGRAVVPSSLRLASSMIVQHLWDNRRGAGVTPAGGDETMLLPGWGYGIPPGAARLLASMPEMAGFA